MDLSKLSGQEIMVLIKAGCIAEPVDVIAAHDEIVQRVIFNNEIIDMEYFERLSSIVTTLRVSIYQLIIFSTWFFNLDLIIFYLFRIPLCTLYHHSHLLTKTRTSSPM